MDQGSVSPHVLIFPFPIQGNINSMLKLAELLCLADIQVTFLNCHYPHRRLLSYSNIQARFSRYPGFRFETISDGLPMEHPRTAEQFLDVVDGVKTTTAPLFMEMMISWCRSASDTRSPLTCIIADGLMSFAIDVANEVGLPVIIFRPISACSFWAYFSLPQLIEAGEVPPRGGDMDRLVASVPGMEGFHRRRHLPSSGRVNDVAYPGLQHLMKIFRQAQRAHSLVINTFDDLEGPVLSQIRDQYPRTYAIGPLHAHLKSKLASETSTFQSSNSFRKEDKSCIPWLDRQPPKSVIYVSFGSLAIITKDELGEFWHGLVNSGNRFLWVIRPDALVGKDEERQTPAELLEGTKDRGYVVGWAPQEEVLKHPAVGGFLTHGGWNSTLESIVEGLPMICWPYFADQQINSRFVSHVWKLGMDMKDSCDRVTVEKMVRDLMVEKRDEFMKAADTLATLAKKCVGEGGSSSCNLNSLIEDIRLLST
ncbi:7-deoxyloganetic acid glucosyltransferase-like [Vitis riparia]|uniref:7-deoxyloganetic acid glucosyltransferase-like n=1 Tax=Vitis riparia TaxID=96939 RepID=UPI00155AC822|nr:7-deoxyloganetic acid glucosyltransferase-like [Vitis riparia]